MPTFKEMQDRINLDYLNRTDLGSETKRAIIRAVKHYEKERFWFNLTATALAVGTASTTVAIPADFLCLDYATILNNGNQLPMTIRSFDRITYQNRGGDSGVPQEICWWRDTFQFFPKPASATSITIHYTFAYPALSADADTSPWTSACEDLIVYRATFDMLSNVLRLNDTTTLQSYKSLELEAYNQLMYGNRIRQGLAEEGSTKGVNHAQDPKLPNKPSGG